MPKTVFDVLTDKIDEQVSSAHTFVAGVSHRITPATEKLLDLFGVWSPQN